VFEHECEVDDGPDGQGLKVVEVTVEGYGAVLSMGEYGWRDDLRAMWGEGASQYIALTKRGTPLHARVTVEISDDSKVRGQDA